MCFFLHVYIYMCIPVSLHDSRVQFSACIAHCVDFLDAKCAPYTITITRPHTCISKLFRSCGVPQPSGLFFSGHRAEPPRTGRMLEMQMQDSQPSAVCEFQDSYYSVVWQGQRVAA